jgi:hypothetical protein
MRRCNFIFLVAVVAGSSFRLTMAASPVRPVSEDLLVQVQLDEGSAYGFIARLEGKTYIFTNSRLISGQDSLFFETLSGKPLKPLKIELALNRDIARFLIDSPLGLETAPSVILEEEVHVLDYASNK